jgi:hypothetical protein
MMRAGPGDGNELGRAGVRVNDALALREVWKMTHRDKILGALGGGAALALFGLFAPAPALAQPANSLPDGQVDCGAVNRLPMGSWTIMSPVTISPNGTTIGLSPGQTFAPNQMYDGVEVTAVLDRNCGNR